VRWSTSDWHCSTPEVEVRFEPESVAESLNRAARSATGGEDFLAARIRKVFVPSKFAFVELDGTDGEQEIGRRQ